MREGAHPGVELQVLPYLTSEGRVQGVWLDARGRQVQREILPDSYRPPKLLPRGVHLAAALTLDGYPYLVAVDSHGRERIVARLYRGNAPGDVSEMLWRQLNDVDPQPSRASRPSPSRHPRPGEGVRSRGAHGESSSAA